MSDAVVCEAIETVADAWDELADRVGASPFLRPGWFAAWWRAFGRGRLQVLVLRDAGRVVGVVPMQQRWGSLRSLTNPHTPEFGPVVEPGYEQGLLRALLSLPTSRLELAYVRLSGAGLDDYRAAARDTGAQLLVDPQELSPVVTLPHDWDAFERRLSHKLVADLRRRRRQLEATGAVSVQAVTDAAGVAAALAEALPIEAGGWKGRAGTAIVNRADTRAFYTDVAHWAATRGWLRLWFLRVGGRAVAFELDLQHGGVVHRVKAGFDEGHRRFAPGKVLLWSVLQQAVSEGLNALHFLGHDEPYKLEWADRVDELVMLRAFGTGVAARLTAAAFTHIRPVARRWRLT